MRNFIFSVVALVVSCGLAAGADVQTLELKCLDPQAITQDEIVLEFYVDGVKVDFTRRDQEGTHLWNAKYMRAGTVHVFSPKTRNRLSFQNELRIIVLERDGVTSDTLGDVVFTPGNSSTESISGAIGLFPYSYELKCVTTP